MIPNSCPDLTLRDTPDRTVDSLFGQLAETLMSVTPVGSILFGDTYGRNLFDLEISDFSSINSNFYNVCIDG